MIYKLKDGDKIQLLPLIDKDGSVVYGKRIARLFMPDGYIIWDTSYILEKIYYTYKQKNNAAKLIVPIGRNYFYLAYINNNVELLSLGFRLNELINKNHADLIGPTRDSCIVVNIKKVMINAQPFDNYDAFISKLSDHNLPLIEDSQWVIDNQPDLSFIYDKSPTVYIDKLRKIFGDDVVGEVLSDVRDKKIEEILK